MRLLALAVLLSPIAAGAVEERTADPLVLPVYEKTRLRGLLEPPAGRRAPDTVTIQGWVDVKRHGSLSAPDATFLERVAVEKGRFEVDVPMAPLDLRIAVPGAAPVYRWKASAESGPIDLGVVPLHPGASISGFVTTAEGGPVDEARVEVAPLGEAATAEAEAASRRCRGESEPSRRGITKGSASVCGLSAPNSRRRRLARRTESRRVRAREPSRGVWYTGSAPAYTSRPPATDIRSGTYE